MTFAVSKKLQIVASNISSTNMLIHLPWTC